VSPWIPGIPGFASDRPRPSDPNEVPLVRKSPSRSEARVAGVDRSSTKTGEVRRAIRRGPYLCNPVKEMPGLFWQ
jgi:hypothetical protein